MRKIEYGNGYCGNLFTKIFYAQTLQSQIKKLLR